MDQETREMLQTILVKLEDIEKRITSIEEESGFVKSKSSRAEWQLEQIQHDTNLCVMALGANNTL